MTTDPRRARLVELLARGRGGPAAEPEQGIAIVGLAARFPGPGGDGVVRFEDGHETVDGTRALDAVWQQLRDGRDAISDIPADRWDAADPAFFVDDKTRAVASGRSYARRGGFLAGGIDRFDALLFGISPREAEMADPQERLFLETAWHAVEDAGLARQRLMGRRIGVFAGAMFGHYQLWEGVDAIANSSFGAIANRVSHVFDWRGPSIGLDTMCSASLTAIHLACEALRKGEIEMALAGGVNLIVHPRKYQLLCQGRYASTDGRCRSFGAGGDGYVPGEGAGAVLLKPLARALADDDPIWGVIRGSAINHGGRSAGSGFTVPSPTAQAAAIADALSAARLTPGDISYIEAHGTGTALGDPIEIASLTRAFGARSTLPVGSVKSNVGHLESAAGVAGLVKILLQMRHRMLVPSLLHSPDGALNPEIDFAHSPLRVQRAAEPWSVDGPLRAGLSAFGAGGSNAHLVVEEPPRRPEPPVARGPALVVLSAQDEERLGVAARLLFDFVSGNDLPLDGLAYTLQTGRDAMTARLAFVAENLDALRTRLRAVVAGRDGPAVRGRAEACRRADGPAIEPAPWDDLDLLAQRWVAGEAVRWEGLYRGRPPRRVRLPGYPFERARHWLAINAPEPPAAPPAAPQGGLFGPPSRDAAGLRHRILPQEPLVRDHLFRGTPLLPAAAMVEMMRSAVQALGTGDEAGVLVDVAWLRPVPIESPVEMLAVLRDEGPRSVVELRTVRPDGDAVVNARARPAGPSARLAAGTALPALRDRLGDERDGAQLYEALAAQGLAYGPAFRVIERFRAGRDEVLATLRLPADAGRDGPVVWHPALLDGALQAAGAILAGEGPALPFAVDRVAGSGLPLPCHCLAHARRRTDAPNRIDVDVLDPDGRCLLRLDGLTVRAVPAPAPDAALPAPGDGAGLRGRLLAALRDLVAATLKLQPERLGEHEDFERFGLQSVHVMDITDALETGYGPVPRTWLFEYRTLAELADRLLEDRRDAVERHLGAPPAGVAPAPARPASGRAAPPAEPAGGSLQDVAVIGVAGRYPGARTLEAFWANLAAGRDCITPVPEARWRTDASGAGPAPSRWGGFLDDVDRFDARFFGISPREAELLDPQERLFLETAWQAIENAALLPTALDGARAGVFVGVMYGLYQLHGPESTAAGRPLAPGSGYWSIANRVSSFFNLQGPSLAVDSACSSSLSAIHLACQALRTGEATIAIAGGVNVASHPQKYLQLAQMHFTSSDGRCRSFGAGGDGYVPGEGVGAVVLKPLAAALVDRDPVWAVIRGSAVNHGGRTNGYTVPSPLAQAEVIRAALDAAGVAPESIDYVEAHGTGTALGDPIEIAGLNRALAGETRGSCALGSVKSNIGHLESAAAVAGLTKILLQMRSGVIAPSLHAAELNPNAAFDAGPCAVQHRLASWPAPVGRGRRAGLSSFGAGGSNGHLIVEEHAADRRGPVADRALVLLSARAAEGLRARAEDLRAWLDATKDVSLADLAYTLQVAREAMPERLALVCRSVAELRDALDAFVARGEVGDRGWRGTAGGAAGAGLDGDAAARAQLAERLVEDGALDEAARHWVAGLDLARALPADVEGVRRRLNLPPLRFAGPRFWVPARSPERRETAVEAAVAKPVAEPAAPVLLLAPRFAAAPGAAVRAPGAVTMTVGLAPEETAALRERQPEPIVAVRDAPSWRQPARDEVSFDLREAAAWGRLDAMRDDATDRIVWRPSAAGDDAAETCFRQLAGMLRHRATSGRAARLDLVVVGPGGPVLRAAAGLLRSAALEMPNIRAVVASLEGAVAPAVYAAIARRELGAIAEGVEEIREVAGERQRTAWIELPPIEPAPLMRPRGTALIIGGMGGLGAISARWLARTCAARLVLVGRSLGDARAASLVDAIADLGGEAIYVPGNVADEDSLARAVAAGRDRFGPLHGVIHAAGVIRDALLARKTEKDLAEVLGPKLAGARLLDRLTASDPLDCFVLFSSLTALLGNMGQVDYGFANAFLDGFGAERAARVSRGERSGRTVSVNWPFWRDGGMRLDRRGLAALERAGLAPLDTWAGERALAAAFASGEPQVAVMTGDPATVRRLFRVREGEAVRDGGAPAAISAGSSVEERLRDLVSAILKVPSGEIDVDESFLDYGFDSITLAELGDVVGSSFGLDLPISTFFELTTLSALARHLVGWGAAAPAPDVAVRAPAAPEAEACRLDAVAVIGMAGRFPAAPDLAAFWNNLVEGRVATADVPADRGAWRAGDGTPYRGGFIAGADRFDPRFFGLSAHEAERMDPQQRLVLEAVWTALEDAACPPSSLAGTSTALFVGVAASDYNDVFRDQGLPVTALTGTGMAHSILVNRISFLLDLTGPSEPVDTACSSSLVAIHRAVAALRSGESDLAIAGGVNLLLTPNLFDSFAQAGMLSPAGRCRPFDRAADGYLRGEGVGVLVLKRLAEALRDGDPIHAVVRGSAARHGGRSASLTAPKPEAQAATLAAAWRAAGIGPDTLGYVEAHGTGTRLGDPVELNGIVKAFRLAGGRDPGRPCAIGSVKSNIGHLETAAGVAGVVKTVLALKHATIPATAGFMEANPELPLAEGGLVLVTRSEPWAPLRRADGSALPRRAGVSSFGFGGVNAHVVLEEAPGGSASPARHAARPRLFPLSAKTPEALRERANRLADHLEAHPDLSPADVAYTLQCGRDAYRHRAAWVATGLRELAGALRAWSAEGASDAEGAASAALSAAPDAATRDVLRAWLAGSVADWRARAEAGARKLHLPTYPFARERYWLPGPAAGHAPAAALRAAARGRPAGIRDALGAVLAEVSGFAPALIKPDTSLEELGFDSLMARQLHARLEEIIGELPPSLPFECATLDALAARLAPLWPEGPAASSPAAPPAAVAPLPPHAAQAGRRSGAPIAVIGLAGRYPDAPDLATFWANLRAGRDSVREVPASRWPWRAYWGEDPDEAAQGRIYGRWGAFLEDAGRFDPAFFQLSAAEAELMDPQERAFLEIAWAVLEDAGYPASARGRGTAPADVGVFAGVTTLSHALWGPERWKRDDMAVPADHPWSMANRVSFLLNLKGPSLPVDTACSSSLTAIHLACESLRSGETAMAIAGGVNLYMHPAKYLKLCQMRMLSPRGRCSSFGADADGFVPGEGVGAALLKRLDRAEADRDFIHAVIRGTAVNHSGRTNGYTVPSPVSQAEVIGAALADAGLDAGAVGYVEAHGTGTALGDPLEIDGLAKALRGGGTGPCLVGSVKSNIGHLEAAAGIAGLTKLILQLRHSEIVPTLHVGTGNPAIHLGGTRFSIARDGTEWDAPAAGTPLTGSVSSFGAGGANAHAVVTAYAHAPSPTPDGEQIVPLSARDRPTVERMARALRAHLLDAPDTRLADVAATLQLGRHEEPQRLAIRADSIAALVTRLGAWLDGDGGTFGVEGQTGEGNHAAFLQGDDEAQELVRAWAGRGRLDKVAGWWAMGGAVDWRSLPQIEHARRIPLPTYPFAGEVYAEVHGAAPLWRLDPPTSDGAADRRDGARRQAVGIAADDPLLLDHKVDGRAILPGAAVLALAARFAAAQAAADRAPPGGLLLADVAWVVPVEAAAAAELTLTVVREGESQDAPSRFALTDRSGVEHATGRLDPNGPASGTPRAAEEPRLAQVVVSEDLYSRFAARGLDYGGSYRTLGDVRFDGDEASAALRVPADAAAWPFNLHPALLDAAFQVTGVFGLDGASAPVLPACLDELAVHCPVQARCRVRARRHAAGLFSVAITGEDGAVCVEAKGLRLRPRASGKAMELCYLPEWRPAEPAPRPGTDSGLALILVPPDGADFAALLAQAHGHARIAPIALGRARAYGPADLEGVDRLFVLAGLGPAAADELSALDAVEEAVLRPLLGVLRGLANGEAVGPKSLTIITDRAQPVHRGDRVRPWAGAFAGLARSADRELTGVAVRCLDLDLADRASWAEQAAAAVAEARDVPDVATDVALAWRKGRRLVERLAPTAMPARAGSDGLSTLMIVGGAGGIGLALARHFADGRGTRVALVGRRPESALASDVRARIAGDPRLSYVQGDAAARPDLERTIATVEARIGPIKGVIHAPLVLRDRLLRGMTETDLDAVLAAKTRGLVALKAALGAREPSFVLVCSSAQSLIGAPGQAHYAAASTFQDAFAAYWDASAPYPVQVVDWGYWGEVGAVASAAYRDRLAVEGVGAIGTAEGLRVVDEVLAAGIRRIVPLKASADLKAALGVFLPKAPGRGGARDTHYRERIPALLARLLSAAAGDAP